MPDEQTQHARSVVEIAVDRIVRSFNIRDRPADPEADAGLTQSIRVHGVLVPLLVRLVNGTYVLVDGGRRLAAATRAGRKTVPAMVEDGPLPEAQSALTQLVANCQRADCSPLDKARAIALVMGQTGGSASEVAGQLGFSGSTVTRLLALLELPEAIRRRVESGEVTASAGYELARVEDPAEQEKLAEQLARGEMTRDGVSGAVKRGMRASKGAADVGRQATRVTAMLGGGRAITVSGPGLTLDGFVECLEELLAKARKARPQGIEIATFVKMLRDQAKA